jgi:hypothetical protein
MSDHEEHDDAERSARQSDGADARDTSAVSAVGRGHALSVWGSRYTRASNGKNPSFVSASEVILADMTAAGVRWSEIGLVLCLLQKGPGRSNYINLDPLLDRMDAVANGRPTKHVQPEKPQPSDKKPRARVARS